jgi:acyl carrier protein
MRKAENNVYPQDEADQQAGNSPSVDGDDIRSCLADIDIVRREETLGFDESLFERRLIDSLGITVLITHLEKTYKINVRQEDLLPDNFDTISAIVQYVNSRIQDSARE